MDCSDEPQHKFLAIRHKDAGTSSETQLASKPTHLPPKPVPTAFDSNGLVPNLKQATSASFGLPPKPQRVMVGKNENSLVSGQVGVEPSIGATSRASHTQSQVEVFDENGEQGSYLGNEIPSEILGGRTCTCLRSSNVPDVTDENTELLLSLISKYGYGIPMFLRTIRDEYIFISKPNSQIDRKAFLRFTCLTNGRKVTASDGTQYKLRFLPYQDAK